MSTIKKRWAGMPKPLRVAGYIVLGLLAVAVMGVVFGYGIMLLWNWLMPKLFNLGTITYWQAIGIFILAKLIFGFSMGGGSKNDKKDGEKTSSGKGCWTEYDAWWEKEGKAAFEKYGEEKGSPD
jgi:hypothetical protein